MTLRLRGHVELPDHGAKKGGFDHAAVHRRTKQLYVAHTANDAVDVIDLAADRYAKSISGLTGVAGALVSEERSLVFTSNRGEDTVGIASIGREDALEKVAVGVRPNGLAFDAERGLLLAANVGDPKRAGTHTLSIVDVAKRAMSASIPVPSRTRWTIFDERASCFYVNVADPPQIVVVEASAPSRIARSFPIPAVGPHGLDLDAEKRRLFCACDGEVLVTLDARSGAVIGELPLSGVPDVIFFNAALGRLYVAIGEPGVIDVIDTERLERAEVVPTELGAHTIGFDADGNVVYAFLPATHRAAVFADA